MVFQSGSGFLTTSGNRHAVCAGLALAFFVSTGFSAPPLPRQAMANLEKLQSFRFTLTLKRSESPIVDGRFTGVVVLPDKESRTGAWQTPAGEISVAVKARGETEYLWEDSTWKLLIRGEEATFLTQVGRVLAFDSFGPTKRQGRFVTSSFVPNIPFLDPARTKKLTSTFRAYADRLLPVDITIQSSDKSIFWQATFSGYDSVPEIEFPFVPQWRVKLVTDSGAPDTVAVRQRFQAFGYAVGFESGRDTAILLLETDVRQDMLKLLLAPGGIQLGIGRLLRPDEKDTNLTVLRLFSDSTRQFVLERVLLSPDDISTLALVESPDTVAIAVRPVKTRRAKLSGLSKLIGSGTQWLLCQLPFSADRETIRKFGILYAAERMDKPISGSQILFPVSDSTWAQNIKKLGALPALKTRSVFVGRERVTNDK